MASTTAAQYGLNQALFVKVVQCESSFNPDAIGDGGTSFGIAQLHNPSTDWHIATSTALDARQALAIMAEAWVNHEQNRWSCYKLSTGT